MRSAGVEPALGHIPSELGAHLRLGAFRPGIRLRAWRLSSRACRGTSARMQPASHIIEDPDGTLIELVEAHKIPLMKKLNLYLNLRKRDPKKPLPKWMLRMLRFMKVDPESLK